MVRNNKTEPVENGLSKEKERDVMYNRFAKGESFMDITREELKGFGFLVSGVTLFVYTLGFFQILNWVIMAAGIILIIYGANKSNLWSKVKFSYNYIRQNFFSKKKNNLDEN